MNTSLEQFHRKRTNKISVLSSLSPSDRFITAVAVQLCIQSGVPYNLP